MIDPKHRYSEPPVWTEVKGRTRTQRTIKIILMSFSSFRLKCFIFMLIRPEPEPEPASFIQRTGGLEQLGAPEPDGSADRDWQVWS